MKLHLVHVKLQRLLMINFFTADIPELRATSSSDKSDIKNIVAVNKTDVTKRC